KESHSLFMVEKTLEAMKKGGIYDQIGGGLCRYSTNHSWLIPHFEKMLYDNSLFLGVLSEAYQITKNPFYESAVRDIINYIERDMRLEEGGIASAEDADSEGEEGKFYTWDFKEFEEVLGEDSDILAEFWNVSDDGNFEGKNILNESFDLDFCKEKNLNENEFNYTLENGKSLLLNRRESRIRPLRDDKVLTSWNCLYITSLAYTGVVLEDYDYLDKAKETYDFIFDKLFDEKRRLLRRYREGEAKYPAYLSDYAELIHASIALYRAFFDITYLEKAKKLTEEVIRLFYSDFGPFYETGVDSEKLLRRSIDGYDGVEPSGNSTMAYVLLLLASYGIESDDYTKVVEDIFKYFKTDIDTRPVSHPFMLKAYMLYNSEINEIVVVHKKHSPKAGEAVGIINKYYFPNSIVVVSSLEELPENSKVIPLLENRESDHEIAIYICKKGICDLPIYNLEDLDKKLGELTK
ncbi:MAG: thioredoxin domain-containing protein, partial [Leptospiraceae bacterium]|nr:thioredoxin domain-containing protein [Leptospiraceae bacterium]